MTDVTTKRLKKTLRAKLCALRGHPEVYMPLDEQVVRAGHEDWDLTVRGEMRCPCGAVKYLEGSCQKHLLGETTPGQWNER